MLKMSDESVQAAVCFKVNCKLYSLIMTRIMGVFFNNGNESVAAVVSFNCLGVAVHYWPELAITAVFENV